MQSSPTYLLILGSDDFKSCRHWDDDGKVSGTQISYAEGRGCWTGAGCSEASTGSPVAVAGSIFTSSPRGWREQTLMRRLQERLLHDDCFSGSKCAPEHMETKSANSGL